jgi:hypothetical protein
MKLELSAGGGATFIKHVLFLSAMNERTSDGSKEGERRVYDRLCSGSSISLDLCYINVVPVSSPSHRLKVIPTPFDGKIGNPI